MVNQRVAWVVSALIFSGCATYTGTKLEQSFGPPEPQDRVVAASPLNEPNYWTDIKPVIEQRCVVCHGCYDAPCQLKMSSIEGIERGASAQVVYQQSRLNMAQPTRLFEDAHSVAEWREKGFQPVLSEYGDTTEANREAGVMYRILELKDENPLPEEKLLPDSFDLRLNRKQFCAKPETFDQYARENPLGGMPFALPAIEREKQELLLRWLEQGGKYTAREPLSAEFLGRVQAWENFLNDDSLKRQLAARYIFEHLFLTHLYFPDLDVRKFFKIVRSTTPPGEPIDLIATRRPYGNPGVDRVYYRLTEELGSVVAKTHLPYALTEKRMSDWQEWFVHADYTVGELPSYSDKYASNPFKTFIDMPVNSRYRFMLDEAQNTINSFIKGPVCRGQVALNVINDHFWIFFIDPKSSKNEFLDDYFAAQLQDLELPASKESIYTPLTHWRRYEKQQREVLAGADAFLTENYTEPDAVSLNVIWEGDGINDNAALTVFRHFDSATVEKGLLGKSPKTAWLIDYTLLERVHYLLVAGYDVYGNAGHQLLSRVYMDFLRMEAETAFLIMLPQEARDRERAFWYRDAPKRTMQFMTLPRFESGTVPAIDYKTDDEKIELFGLIKERLAPVLPKTHDLSTQLSDVVGEPLGRLENLKGESVTLMPEVAFVEIRGQSSNSYVSLVRNIAHLNITPLFSEEKYLAPQEDTLTVVPGFIGTYPNVFLTLEESDLEQFVAMLSDMRSEDDYSSLLDSYGVRRTNSDFWQQGDAFHAAYKQEAPIEYGLFDFSRLENR